MNRESRGDSLFYKYASVLVAVERYFTSIHLIARKQLPFISLLGYPISDILKMEKRKGKGGREIYL